MIKFSEHQMMQLGATSDGELIERCQSPKSHWIEIELLGEDDLGISDESFEVRLPDKSVVRGKLDRDGFARIEWGEPGGQCQVCFPDLDGRAWSFIDSLEAKPQ